MSHNVYQATQCPDLISIIIPIYNTGEYLRETLNSCLQKSYAHIEVQAMDDKDTFKN